MLNKVAHSPSLSLCLVTLLKSSSLAIDRCNEPNGMVGIVVEPPVWVAFNATDCGKIGLHGECELTDALDDVSGTPDVEYKSWLNCKTKTFIKTIKLISIINVCC